MQRKKRREGEVEHKYMLKGKQSIFIKHFIFAY